MNWPPRLCRDGQRQRSEDTTANQSPSLRRWQRHQVYGSARLRRCEQLDISRKFQTAPERQHPWTKAHEFSVWRVAWCGVRETEACGARARARVDATTIPRYVSLPCALGHLLALAASCDTFRKVGQLSSVR